MRREPARGSIFGKGIQRQRLLGSMDLFARGGRAVPWRGELRRVYPAKREGTDRCRRRFRREEAGRAREGRPRLRLRNMPCQFLKTAPLPVSQNFTVTAANGATVSCSSPNTVPFGSTGFVFIGVWNFTNPADSNGHRRFYFRAFIAPAASLPAAPALRPASPAE